MYQLYTFIVSRRLVWLTSLGEMEKVNDLNNLIYIPNGMYRPHAYFRSGWKGFTEIYYEIFVLILFNNYKGHLID